MTSLSPVDQMLRFSARWVSKPLMASLPPRLLRSVAETSATIASRPPRGTRTAWRDGCLWVTPPGIAEDADLLVHIHGGGFVLGSPRTHMALAAHLAQAAGLRAVLPGYPLSPEATFPAARDACIAAWARITAMAGTPKALSGDSAGACLALQVAMSLRDDGRELPRRMGLISPLADLTGTAAELVANRHSEHLIPEGWARASIAAYLGQADASDPDVSPLFADLSGLPKTHIQYSETEVLAGDARRLAARLDAELTALPDLPHLFHIYAGFSPAAEAALVELGRFLGGAA
ncbi:MAG: alpha/beta hydrolase fold domain-containing protein [Dinoroseobacter sp.]|nr:alpha/beta hydrolase fold domain-containing protein [Dinoroseobacter sp.]